MATIKSYTDIEQSKKLAEILPLESADMYYPYRKDKPEFLPISDVDVKCLSQPCWSLAVLLSVLPNGIIMNKDSQNGKYHFSSTYIGTYVTADNPVDTCYEMILKLNELNLL